MAPFLQLAHHFAKAAKNGLLLWSHFCSFTAIPTSYISALDFWHSLVWNFEFHELDFLSPVWTWFLQATQAVKIQFKLGKKTVQQTQNFKLENVQNQVQRDRRLLRLVLFVLFLFVKSKKTHSKFGIENSWKYDVISSKMYAKDSILKIFSFLKYFRHWSPAINGIQKISKVLYPPPLIWSNHQSWRPCLTWMNQMVATKIMRSIFQLCHSVFCYTCFYKTCQRCVENGHLGNDHFNVNFCMWLLK